MRRGGDDVAYSNSMEMFVVCAGALFFTSLPLDLLSIEYCTLLALSGYLPLLECSVEKE